MLPKWSSKFELKPGKWVFVPTDESVAEGKKIKRELEKRWTPPPYYFHLRAGGHVEALRAHLKHSVFVRFDIHDFFGSINRTRVTRCLKDKFGYSVARAYANASTVPDPGGRRTMVPFGFVQSQIVAAVCLAESALGLHLERLAANPDVTLTVYVDDIIVSSSSMSLLEQLVNDVQIAAARAHFVLSAAKCEGPAALITAFNIMLKSGSMEVNPERLMLFEKALAEATNEHQRAGITSYVTSINVTQGLALKASWAAA